MAWRAPRATGAARLRGGIRHYRAVGEGRCVPVIANQGPNEADPVLDAEGAARLLHVSTKTLLKSARAGEIPGQKVGREWRFARSALIEFLARPVSA
ncbi:MAG: helix-turn-helix domain-containing protein [Acidimicrobiales bacterium]